MNDEERARAVAQPLLDWFEQNKRDLPWRRTSDPYRIWVSEIMLQQTQVDRVIDYYERFVEVFPTVEDLADPLPGEVLQLWEGLGYYRRARHMVAAAQQIVEEHEGEFPRTLAEAGALPGVGEYTAGAVLSIAYGIPVPALDANAIRVIARIFAVRGDVARGKARRKVEALVVEAMPDDRPGDFNQALMELGALLCTAGIPGCLVCPLTEVCATMRQGLQEQIPPSKSAPIEELSAVAGVVWRGDQVLVARRPADGQWGGLWEFPNVHYEADEAPRAAIMEHLSRAFGLRAEVEEELTSLTYGVMNRRVSLTVLRCRLTKGEATATEHDEARWVVPDELEELAMPSPHRKLAGML